MMSMKYMFCSSTFNDGIASREGSMRCGEVLFVDSRVVKSSKDTMLDGLKRMDDLMSELMKKSQDEVLESR